ASYGSVCFSGKRRHTSFSRDWSSDVCSSDLGRQIPHDPDGEEEARRGAGAGRTGHDGEGRTGADLPTRPAPARGGSGLDRELPAFGRASCTGEVRDGAPTGKPLP